ncbi:39S ribosomal protein L44, mitochondrial [Zalaria obscura]|uniref:39S ribosomal protein L44, mitochondrial n=1 Tax=Zalaria obscura TaxID=2024903 RepID=A0ACC3SN34_9PEZI
MITRFLTEVRTTFSPFNPKSGKTARNFLALLPPNARQSMKIDIKMMPKEDAAKPSLLALKFKDGKEMNLDLEKYKIRDLQEEVDRHSRMLGRQEELSG